MNMSLSVMTGGPQGLRGAAADQRPGDRVTERQRVALKLTAGLMVASLFLQRFDIPIGGAICLSGPVGFAVLGWAAWRGGLAFDRARLLTFIALTACILLGVAWNVAQGGAREVKINSLLQFLALTSFAVLSFAEPVDETRFFRTVNFWFGVIAAAGILQFMVQLAGIQIFSFANFVPPTYSFEFGYNVQIPAGVGDLLKSNGFFLLEPSIFSQIMALGLIIEVLSGKRRPFIGLFAAGLVFSFSGTGWIVLATFVCMAAVGMGWRGIVLALSLVAVAAVAAGAVTLVSPDLAAVFQSRLDEFNRPGTSGHLRFVTPFWVLSDTIDAFPSAALLGIGSGASERLTLPYEYNVNTPIKIALEYGFPALAAYVLLFILGRRTRVQGAIVAPAVVLFFFTGGYQQFPPMIFITLLLTSVARLRPAVDAGEPAVAGEATDRRNSTRVATDTPMTWMG